jgi:hypothetical protein
MGGSDMDRRDTLLVRYASALRIFKQNQRLSGVRIDKQGVQR